MIVGVDIDGILADFNTGYIKLLNTIRPDIKFPPVSPTYPNVWNYHYAAGVTKEEAAKSWALIREDTNFWFSLDPYPDAVSFLVWLKSFSRKNDIYFVTDRAGQTAKYQTERWLHKAGFPEPTVLLSPHKAMICKGLKANYYIDDKNENCQSVAAESSDTKVFMLKRGWNEPQEGVPVIDKLIEFQNKLVLSDLTAR